MRDPARPAEELAALRAQLAAQATVIARLEAALARERRRADAAEAAREPPRALGAPGAGDAAAAASAGLPLAALIREARRRRGWSQRALAARVGCTPKTVWRLEHAPPRRPHVRIKRRLAAALDLPLETVEEAFHRQGCPGAGR